MTSVLAYSNRLFGKGTWTDVGTTFDTDPPIANLSTSQVPLPAAAFSGASAEFQFAALDAAGAAENFTARVLALLSMDIADGATITWKRSDDSVIATESWSRFKNRPANSILILGADETLDTIKCSITDAGTGAHRIGAAWAGPGWLFQLESGFRYRPQSSGNVTRVSGTDWPFADVRRRGIPVAANGSRGKILGVNDDGSEFAGMDAESVLYEARQFGPAIVVPGFATAAEIRGTSIYGLIDTVGEPENLSGPTWRVEFTVLESR